MSREEDRRFIRSFMLVIGGLVVTAILLVVIATSLYPGNYEAREALNAERAAKNLEPVGAVRLTGEAMPASAGGGEEQAASKEPRTGEEVFNQVCSACHKSGVLGAPVVGNKEDWADRVSKGLSTLISQAENGYKNMPPQKAQASEQEIHDAIVWMVKQSDLSFPQ